MVNVNICFFYVDSTRDLNLKKKWLLPAGLFKGILVSQLALGCQNMNETRSRTSKISSTWDFANLDLGLNHENNGKDDLPMP